MFSPYKREGNPGISRYIPYRLEKSREARNGRPQRDCSRISRNRVFCRDRIAVGSRVDGEKAVEVGLDRGIRERRLAGSARHGYLGINPVSLISRSPKLASRRWLEQGRSVVEKRKKKRDNGVAGRIEKEAAMKLLGGSRVKGYDAERWTDEGENFIGGQSAI